MSDTWSVVSSKMPDDPKFRQAIDCASGATRSWGDRRFRAPRSYRFPSVDEEMNPDDEAGVGPSVVAAAAAPICAKPSARSK
eukprot:8559538-Pyramimonas_sp.AAC.1